MTSWREVEMARYRKMPWYEWTSNRDRLVAWSKALQGGWPYHVRFEPNKAKCQAAFTDFTNRRITINPVAFGANAKMQFDHSKGLLAHEAGHKRFTTPTKTSPIVHHVSNLLEDERIERLMEAEFTGVRGPLRRLSREVLSVLPELNPESEDVQDVIVYILQRRLAMRCRGKVKGKLSAGNARLLRKCWPLVKECWTASTSEVCDANAAKIVEILGLTELDEAVEAILGIMEALEGMRGELDEPDEDAPEGMDGDEVDPEAEIEGDEDDFDDPMNAVEGEPVSYPHGVGHGDHVIVPVPYQELQARAEPMARRLAEALRIGVKDTEPEPVERGGRFNMREYLRNQDTPFVIREDAPAAKTVEVRVLVDHSTSMNTSSRRHGGAMTRMEAATLAAMTVHLACRDTGTKHVISVCPDDIRIADEKNGEHQLALIAGMNPAQTGYEDIGRITRVHAQELMRSGATHKVIIVIADGETNDISALTNVCKEYHSKILILGIALGPDSERLLMTLHASMGEDRVVQVEDPETLPVKLASMIRNIRGI